MYTGERGDRTIEQWLIDALEAYREPGGIEMAFSNQLEKFLKGVTNA